MNEVAIDRVTVMGLGRFGGGVGVTRYLASQPTPSIVVTDLADHDSLHDSVASLSDLVRAGRVELHLGEHRESDFTATDMVVANPAVKQPWNNHWLQLATGHGAILTTEIGLTIARLPQPDRVIAVTGSLGKSTTAAMIHHILTRHGQPAHLGGNIGGSLLDTQVNTNDWVVIELSSAMLYWLAHGLSCQRLVEQPWTDDQLQGWSPTWALVTNISPNHADWHGSARHYEQSKQQIVRNQKHNDVALLCEQCARWPALGHGRRIGCENVKSTFSLLVSGQHNQTNAQVAAQMCALAAGVDIDTGLELLSNFTGLPHRLCCVARLDDGRAFYDDSKASTPDATLRAVSALGLSNRIHLIAGGYDKGIDLAPLAQLAHSLAGLYTIGQTGPMIAQAISAGHVYECETLDRAVERAMNRMKANEILLLSPGCASWDQFTSFVQRGERFVSLVKSALNPAG